MGTVMLLWVLNFGISILNAWGCGHTWNESKAEGGFVHFLNWCGATMSACGFTWCYTIVLAFIGSMIPIEQDDGTTAMLLDAQALQATLELGYVVIILPVLGSGLVITLETWAHFWRRRTFGSGALAGYNTFAQIHNIYSAAQTLPGVFDHLGDFFGGDSGGKKDFRLIIVVVIVAVAVLGGILTTWMIIRTTASSVANTRTFENEMRR